MVPLRLCLRNFLCYRDQVTLDLEGLRLACLCGNNGNGKSALLDAVTWALWGRARARASDELIHVAESEMEVELEFLVGSQRYRVQRRHSRPRRASGAGQTTLELHQASADGFVPLTGDSLRQTEQHIGRLLGLDYETFINSAFLLQGRADEFTVKPPSQRKQVLANILGLDYYDRAAGRARELAREREGQRQALESALARIEAELEHLPRYQQEVQGLEAQLGELASRLDQARSHLRDLEATRHHLEAQQAQLGEARQARQQAEERLEYWRGELARLQQSLKSHEAVVSQAASIQEGYARWQQASAWEQAQAEKLAQAMALGQERGHLEQAIADARHRLEAERRGIEGQMALWRPQAQALPGYEQELGGVRARLEGLSQAEAGLADRLAAVEAAAIQEQAVSLRLKQLGPEMQELREKAHLLDQAGARCPLCGSELGVGGQERLRAQFSAQVEEKAQELRRLEQERSQRHRDLQTLQGQTAQERHRLARERAALEGRLQALDGDISRARQASSRVAQARQQLTRLEQRLSTAVLLPQEQARLQELLAQESSLAYDPAQHQAAREERDSLQMYQELHQRLEEAQRSLEVERRAVTAALAEVGQWQEARQAAGERLQLLEVALADLPRVLEEGREAQALVDSLAQEHARLQAALGAARQRLEDCLALHREREVHREALRRAAEDKALYEELAEAFGKRGIQALIIETVLPDLETEANRLLAQMTDNRMRLTLETQRPRRAGSPRMAERQARSRGGEPIETLDINISDEWSTRPYELYSGGEAFRINFALRIALSKLLARRAGAPLPTLFIDEGFGTQDASGREKLVEAIQSIQDDFELILVVTHIDEMKEAFPVRIEVSKTEAGSTISIS